MPYDCNLRARDSRSGGWVARTTDIYAGFAQRFADYLLLDELSGLFVTFGEDGRKSLMSLFLYQ